jgi:hypothetical protein
LGIHWLVLHVVQEKIVLCREKRVGKNGTGRGGRQGRAGKVGVVAIGSRNNSRLALARGPQMGNGGNSNYGPAATAMGQPLQAAAGWLPGWLLTKS